jgi:prenyltransferase beta subunit
VVLFVCYDSKLLNHSLLQNPCHIGSHLASTYSALAILKIVGYDLTTIDRKALLSSMRKLQEPDGRYAFSIDFPYHVH